MPFCPDHVKQRWNPPHPGLSVRHECLEPPGLSVTEAARKLGIGRKQFSDIVNCRSGISHEMAIRLDKAFGGGAETWYRLQSAWNPVSRSRSSCEYASAVRSSQPHRFSRHARTCSTAVRFNFGAGCAPMSETVSAPRCHPGLVPGSRMPRKPGLAPRHRLARPNWTPEQVRGDSGGTRTAGAGGPRSVSRSGGSAGNPPVPTSCTRSSQSKPDSGGLVPGMT